MAGENFGQFGSQGMPASPASPWATSQGLYTVPNTLGTPTPKMGLTETQGTRLIDMQEKGMNFNMGMGAGSALLNAIGNGVNAAYQFSALNKQYEFQGRLIDLSNTVEDHRYALQDKSLNYGKDLQIAGMKSQERLADKENSFKLQKAKLSADRDVRLAEVQGLNQKFGQPYNYGSPLQALGIG